MRDYRQSSPLRRLVRQAAATGPTAWLGARAMHHVDRLAHRATRGRTTFSSLVSGLPVVMLTTTGAKTGQPRTVPVLALPDDDRLIVVGTNYGRANHPAWYHNLRANPHASVTVGGVTRAVEARELTGEERERHLQRSLEINPGWARYRRRAAATRRIPVISLDPAS
jgi:deazaflavin-dependent oxidoreductase (nitroreductase family)